MGALQLGDNDAYSQYIPPEVPKAAKYKPVWKMIPAVDTRGVKWGDLTDQQKARFTKVGPDDNTSIPFVSAAEGKKTLDKGNVTGATCDNIATAGGFYWRLADEGDDDEKWGTFFALYYDNKAKVDEIRGAMERLREKTTDLLSLKTTLGIN
ncbi:MAG: hypothetical protein ACR2ON_03250 [Paracoccaceae bacterium]